jgi:cellulose synthase/poly-beta-1,6-N-acetylglucosamine synthase-like glycosyltransferase
MLVRLALLFLLIVLAPLGMLCFGLPQTQGYGRLWTSTFAVTLFVQFFQVVTLALGGMLISYTQTTGLLNLDAGVVSLLVSTAVISLVLHIPGMIRNWALRPIAQAGLASAQIAGQLISTFAA